MHRTASGAMPFAPPEARAMRQDPVAGDLRIVARSVADVAGFSTPNVGEDR